MYAISLYLSLPLAICYSTNGATDQHVSSLVPGVDNDEAGSCRLDVGPSRVITSYPWPEPETLRLRGVAGPNCELFLFKVRVFAVLPKAQNWRCAKRASTLWLYLFCVRFVPFFGACCTFWGCVLYCCSV